MSDWLDKYLEKKNQTETQTVVPNNDFIKEQIPTDVSFGNQLLQPLKTFQKSSGQFGEGNIPAGSVNLLNSILEAGGSIFTAGMRGLNEAQSFLDKNIVEPLGLTNKNLGIGETPTTSQIIEYPFQKVAEGVGLGQEYVAKGLDKIGLDKKAELNALKLMQLQGLMPEGDVVKQREELIRSGTQLNQGLAQLLTGKVIGDVGVKVKNLIPTKELPKTIAKPDEIIADVTEVPKVDLTQEKANLQEMLKSEVEIPQVLRDNKTAIDDLLENDPSLSGSPKLISKRLTSMVEKGELNKKVSVETIKSIADEWIKKREKPEVQEIKTTPNELGLAIPNELNSKRAVTFDKNIGLTVKEVLEKNPEFKPYVENLTDINEVTTKLNGLYWKKRHGEKLPELELPLKEEVKYYRGEREGQTGDIFITSSKEVASEFGKVKEIKESEIPKNLFETQDKVELGRELGLIKDQATENQIAYAPDFDAKIESILRDKGYEGVKYKSGTFDAEEIHVFKKPKTTTIKNEVVNTERGQRGLTPIETSMKRDWGTVWDEAKTRIDKNPELLNTLPKELSENPRPITDTESAILTYNRERIKSLHDKANQEYIKNPTPENKLNQIKLEDELNTNELASKHTGSEVARALNIRRMEIKDDYTLAPLLQRARTANNYKQVPDEIRTKLEDYSKKITEGESKVKSLEVRLKNLEAENFLKDLAGEKFKTRTERRVQSKELLDTEYEGLVKEWVKTQQFNALVDPKQVQLMVKMAVNRLQKGGISVEQVIDQIYQVAKNYIKDLTIDDVRDALRGGGRFAKLSEKEIKSELRNIKKTPMDTLQKSYKTRLENRKAELEEMLRTGNYERKPRRKTEMTPELRDLKDQVDVLKQHADREIRLLERKNMTKGERLKEFVVDVANVPRTLKASFDLSAPFRQGLPLIFDKPSQVFGQGGSFREMFKYFSDEKAIRELRRQIEESPNSSLYLKSKLYLANEKTNIGRVAGREEAFMSDLPEKIPGLGIGIRASNRAYAGFLDKLRMDVFDYYANEFQKTGKTFESDPKLYKDLAKAINTMSGRGTLGRFDNVASALSVGIFSPRLIASRLQLMNPTYYFKLSPEVRKIVAKDMLKFIGVGLSILSMAKLAGMDVESDPTSSDFGKIKKGNTRIDVWGGFQQYGVLGARLLLNSTKDANGEKRSLSGQEFPFTTRKDLVQRFAEQKLSPTFGLMRDLLNNKTFMGEDLNLSKEAINLMVPLYLNDLYNAAQEEGMDGLLMTTPGIFGVGTQTYKTKTKTKTKPKLRGF